MVIKIVKVFFVFACIVMGIMWAYYLTGEFSETANANIRILGIPQRLWVPIGGITGAIIATAILLAVQFITQEIYERIAPALVAIVLAMVAGYFIGQYIFFWAPQAELTLRIFVMVSLVLIFRRDSSCTPICIKRPSKHCRFNRYPPSSKRKTRIRCLKSATGYTNRLSDRNH